MNWLCTALCVFLPDGRSASCWALFIDQEKIREGKTFIVNERELTGDHSSNDLIPLEAGMIGQGCR